MQKSTILRKYITVSTISSHSNTTIFTSTQYPYQFSSVSLSGHSSARTLHSYSLPPRLPNPNCSFNYHAILKPLLLSSVRYATNDFVSHRKQFQNNSSASELSDEDHPEVFDEVEEKDESEMEMSDDMEVESTVNSIAELPNDGSDDEEGLLNTSVIIESKDLVWSNEILDSLLPNIKDSLRPTLAQTLPVVALTPENTKKAIRQLHDQLLTLSEKQISFIIQRVPYILSYNRRKLIQRLSTLYFFMPALTAPQIHSIIARHPKILAYSSTVAIRERFVQLQQLLPHANIGRMVYWKPSILLHAPGAYFVPRLNTWASVTKLSTDDIRFLFERLPPAVSIRYSSIALTRVVETEEFQQMWASKLLPEFVLKLGHYYTN